MHGAGKHYNDYGSGLLKENDVFQMKIIQWEHSFPILHYRKTTGGEPPNSEQLPDKMRADFRQGKES